jgi:hypothetical protein
MSGTWDDSNPLVRTMAGAGRVMGLHAVTFDWLQE